MTAIKSPVSDTDVFNIFIARERVSESCFQFWQLAQQKLSLSLIKFFSQVVLEKLESEVASLLLQTVVLFSIVWPKKT